MYPPPPNPSWSGVQRSWATLIGVWCHERWLSAHVPTHPEYSACPLRGGWIAWLIVLMEQWRPWVQGQGHSAGSLHTPTPPNLSRGLQAHGTPKPTPTPKWAPPLPSSLAFCLPPGTKGVLFCTPEWALEPWWVRPPSIVRPLDFGSWLQSFVATWPWIHYLTPLFLYVIICKMGIILILPSQSCFVNWMMSIHKTLRRVPGTRSEVNSMSYSNGYTALQYIHPHPQYHW